MERIIIILLISTLFPFLSIAEEVIDMEKGNSGVYTIPCEINGLKLKFKLDTGASFVCISQTEATFMLKNGYLTDSDIIGTANIQIADGNIAECYVINLKQIKIGYIVLQNIMAVIFPGLDVPLLGQSALEQLGQWSIRNGQLILYDNSDTPTIERDLNKNFTLLVKQNKIDQALNYIKTINFEDESLSKKIKSLYFKYILDNNLQKENLNRILQVMCEVNYFGFGEETSSNILNNMLRVIKIVFPKYSDEEAAQYLVKSNVFNKNLKDSLYQLIFEKYWLNHNDELAKKFAKEAISLNFYGCAYEYCCYYLIQEKKYSEAFNILKMGSYLKYAMCTYELAAGYLRNIWPEKNINLGLKLLDSLADKNHWDAIIELCWYYWDKEDYEKMLKYANKLEDSQFKKILEAVAYFNQKNYHMAYNRLKFIDEKTYFGRIRYYSVYYMMLGQIYENGLACEPDFNKAFDYYTKLIEYDSGWAYGLLGDMFYLNDLIKEDPEIAYKYYLLGANNDDGYCCFRVALMNYYGSGTDENESLANKYKEKAVKLGIKESEFNF